MSQGFDASKPGYQDALQSSPVRLNLNALATCHRAATAPSDPDEGWLWLDVSDVTNYKLKMYLSGSWITILNNLLGGFPTQAGATLVTHTQATPSASWTIVHGLNTEIVAVQFWDSAALPKNMMLPDNVEITTANSLTVTWNTAVTGQAIVIG